jgi:hypothetical protein
MSCPADVCWRVPVLHLCTVAPFELEVSRSNTHDEVASKLAEEINTRLAAFTAEKASKAPAQAIADISHEAKNIEGGNLLLKFALFGGG